MIQKFRCVDCVHGFNHRIRHMRHFRLGRMIDAFVRKNELTATFQPAVAETPVLGEDEQVFGNTGVPARSGCSRTGGDARVTVGPIAIATAR
jgi:hypothetical protein